jgi:predicted nucleic acid-binding protein
VNLLLDSVILIDHFNGMDAATHHLATYHADAAISVITRAEVLACFEEREVGKPAQFLDSFATLGIDQAIADLAASLRRKQG